MKAHRDSYLTLEKTVNTHLSGGRLSFSALWQPSSLANLCSRLTWWRALMARFTNTAFYSVCVRERKRQTRGPKPEKTSSVGARSFIRHRPRILLCQLCVHCAAFRNMTPTDDLENLPLRCSEFNTPLSEVGMCVCSDILPFCSRFYIYIISRCVILCSSPQPEETAWGPVHEGVLA